MKVGNNWILLQFYASLLVFSVCGDGSIVYNASVIENVCDFVAGQASQKSTNITLNHSWKPSI